MNIGEICTRTVSRIDRKASLVDAARQMREEHVGDLVVVEQRGGRAIPVGVLTDRDIVVGVLAKDADHLRTLEAGDVVMGTLVTATEDEDLEPVLHRMRLFGVRRIPVVDGHGAVTGLLSIDDILPALSDEVAELAFLVSRQADREPKRRP
jgi:CBS domain-containing protein